MFGPSGLFAGPGWDHCRAGEDRLDGRAACVSILEFALRRIGGDDCRPAFASEDEKKPRLRPPGTFGVR